LAKGKTRAAWGHAEGKVPGTVVKVYIKPTGAKTYRLAGKATCRWGDGLWVVHSAKIQPGQLYAVSESPYLTTEKSPIFKGKKAKFAKKLPNFPEIAVG
jgi:hypothetical protein